MSVLHGWWPDDASLDRRRASTLLLAALAGASAVALVITLAGDRWLKVRALDDQPVPRWW